MIIVALWKQDYDKAKDLFVTILPVASGIVSYWFATRTPRKEN